MKEKPYAVYCILNTRNDKRYIGISCNHTSRLWTHFSQLKHNKHTNEHLQRAFNKYGRDAFVSFTFYTNISLPAATGHEKDLIKKYKDLDLCYNIQNCFCGIGQRTEETIDKVRQALKGKPRPPRSQEWCRNISNGRKGVTPWNKGKSVGSGVENHFYGKKHSEETKEKIRQANLGKKRGPMSEEQKEKIRQAHIGKECSPETKEKIRQANLGKRKGIERM